MDACSAALLIEGEVIERYELAPREHARLILKMIDAVLIEGDISLHSLDALAFGCGPGAFTGLRIAASVAQGIAFTTDLPTVPVSSLAAIAREGANQAGCSRIAVAVDARMQEVYWATYLVDQDETVKLSGTEKVCSSGLVALPKGEKGKDWFGAGSGWGTYGDMLKDNLGIEHFAEDCYPRAGDIATLGVAAYRQGNIVTPDRIVPVYLRDKVTS